MPGGGVNLLHSEYAKAADLLFEIAMSKNNHGTYFPIWATCLSFEKLVTYFTGNNLKWQSFCDVQDVSLNLIFPQGLNKTRSTVRMFRNSPAYILDILAHKNVTANYHRICLSVDTFEANKNLTGKWLSLEIADFILGGVKVLKHIFFKNS